MGYSTRWPLCHGGSHGYKMDMAWDLPSSQMIQTPSSKHKHCTAQTVFSAKIATTLQQGPSPDACLVRSCSTGREVATHYPTNHVHRLVPQTGPPRHMPVLLLASSFHMQQYPCQRHKPLYPNMPKPMHHQNCWACGLTKISVCRQQVCMLVLSMRLSALDDSAPFQNVWMQKSWLVRLQSLVNDVWAAIVLMYVCL